MAEENKDRVFVALRSGRTLVWLVTVLGCGIASMRGFRCIEDAQDACRSRDWPLDTVEFYAGTEMPLTRIMRPLEPLAEKTEGRGMKT